MITGYAAVYYDGNNGTQFKLGPNYVERFLPGAFDRFLETRADVVGLFNHDASLVLGRLSAGTLKLRADARGLFYEISEADTSVSRDVQEHQRRGDVIGSSLGFRAVNERHRQEGSLDVREILDVDIRDVGPVTYPAYAGTADEVRFFTVAGHSMALPEGVIAEERCRPRYRNYMAERIAARAREIDLDIQLGSDLR